jgi:Icc-related predicted phosphoesterase
LTTTATPGSGSPDAPKLSGAKGENGAFRIAAVGDLHHGTEGQGAGRALLRSLVTEVEAQADLLLLCGDLTSHGRPEEAIALVSALEGLTIPTLAVLGNHEFDAGAHGEVTRILGEHGIRVLDGDAVEIGGVGFAGVKGFAGGFGRATLAAFGEPAIKAFVQEALDEAFKLENALRRLATPVKVVLLHYSPTPDTLEGEPLEILPFLGSSRLLPPLEAMEVNVVFHGHAHTGKPEGRTPGGIPVFNVALPLLQGQGRLFHVWQAPTPTPVGGA